jgi:DNA modification methylase
MPVASLAPYARNARTHSKAQVAEIARSIAAFGFTNPVLVTDAGSIVAGHGRVEAAKRLGMERVPCLRLSHLSEDQVRAYVIADNKLAEKAGWDRGILAIEMEELVAAGFDLELTGFDLAEIDLLLDDARAADPRQPGLDAADQVPEVGSGPSVSRPGDIWQLGRHRLAVGDARDEGLLTRLFGTEVVDLVFTDPPYNVRIDGNATGLGKVRHREFAFASGELTPEAFTSFLSDALGAAVGRAKDGAILFAFMDWRHMGEMLAAGARIGLTLKNLIVWAKTNAGMGTFYRSAHELIFAWKVGTAPHLNSFGLGETGRYGTNVWTYAGANSFSATRAEDLAAHPTVKPVALVRDAIEDCSRRGEIVFDPFGGSGTTLVAAELCGRRARLVEIDPSYTDVTIRRFETLTGQKAVHAETGEAFGARLTSATTIEVNLRDAASA